VSPVEISVCVQAKPATARPQSCGARDTAAVCMAPFVMNRAMERQLNLCPTAEARRLSPTRRVITGTAR